ncbi:acetamidase/formamidase family protein [Halorarius halobius]|uniref:acetamidase/formamidase family protein n=1 Tax=Halorarius halobius TaxID=2962671 RepID=UPI0020CD0DD5|nr:acetamidase/formamidase family protein [Halorarius halobius]
MPDHTLSRDDAHLHYDWDRDRDPVLTVESGATVAFECRDSANGELPRGATVADLDAVEAPGHALTGPVAIEGATPGDTLAVDVLDVSHEGVGWTYVYPGEAGAGFLPEQFPEGRVYTWDLDGDVGQFVDGIEVPLDPFPGIVGLAPAEPGSHSTTPPRRVGGNLDVKHLTPGSTLFLPVEVAGGLLSVGDLHAAQGDGEVCITAIEMPGRATVRVRLVDRDVDGPVFETDGPFEPVGGCPVIATSGVDPDHETAAREAVSGLVSRLHEEHGLDRLDAYMLCSVAADLKVNEVVNGNVVVSAYLSRSLV